MRSQTSIKIERVICMLCAAGVLCLYIARCTPTVVTTFYYEDKLLSEADSMFHTGNYEYAKMKYTKIRDEYPKTTSGAKAQFNLAYTNIYYDNPFADYNAALREFKRFATTYPNDQRVDMVYNWIRILTILQDFSKNFYGSNSQLRQLQNRQSSIFQNYSSIQDAFLRCDKTKDSLLQRIQVLEGIIAEIDKIR